MATDPSSFSPFPLFNLVNSLFLWVGPSVSIVEKIRRIVIRHSGASFLFYLYIFPLRMTRRTLFFFFTHLPYPTLLYPTGTERGYLVLGFVADENDDGSGPHHHHFRSLYLSLSAAVLLCAFLGLDGIDNLGLGGALRRAWAVFRYGIYTWHHCRYVIILVLYPSPLWCYLSFFMDCIGSGLYALAFGIMGLLPAPRVARQ